MFNPSIQSEKFDKFCEYIRKWIPELRIVENFHIHNWEVAHEYPEYKNIAYPGPIVLHREEKANCIKMYTDALVGTGEEMQVDDSEFEDLYPDQYIIVSSFGRTKRGQSEHSAANPIKRKSEMSRVNKLE